MNDITVTAHLTTDTRTRVVVFADHDFVSLRIGGGTVDVALIAPAGTADILRAISAAADQAARELDTLPDLDEERA
ncbi:hypothetical protein [Streptomyces xantholiticus]|uniref:hypothetical protein n=1 Tax=Streptomyces xantholiticus TaxID=68285 RepID=UPI0016781C08|nr:hypothetical protein [Streptomyces xantholiticus]GGW73488.1 hypothetical protein GCM10010381_67850 [Streptomyces xantholiticus]